MRRYIGKLNTIQYTSDVHIDVNRMLMIKPIAPNLIIAGDIANGWGNITKKWLKDTCSQFQRVFFCPGNHEYYGSKSYNSRDNEMRETASQINNLYYLNGEYEVLEEEKVIIYGNTLWSNIPKDIMKYYRNCSDFRNIKYLNPDTYNDLNYKATLNLASFFYQIRTDAKIEFQHPGYNFYMDEFFGENADPYNYTPIIVTHHPPLLENTCDPKYYQTEKTRIKYHNHMYCNNMIG
jgi:hypothetical protein